MMAFTSPSSAEFSGDAQETTLSSLLQHPAIWQAKHASALPSSATVSSGYKIFDEQLHLGGWPCNGSTEILCDQIGIGEFSILLPALKSLLQQPQQRRLALVAPPYVPYAPALQHYGIDLHRLMIIQAHKTSDQLWVSEQLLRCGHFAAVINWFDLRKSHGGRTDCAQPNYAKLRRIQLAAQEGRCWSINFKASVDSQNASPAGLRIKLQSSNQQLALRIIKQQGGWAGQTVRLPRPDTLLENTMNVNHWIKKDSADHYQGQTANTQRHHTLAGHSFTSDTIRNFHSGLERHTAYRRRSQTTRSIRQ